MKLTFNRSKTIEVKIQKPDAVRAFVFDLDVAIGKSTEPQVDPMSGMLLNLVDVDGIMADFCKTLTPMTSLQSLLQNCCDFFTARLRLKSSELREFYLREKRGFWCGWTDGVFIMGFEETREWNGGVWKFSSERLFDEAQIEGQSLNFGASPEAVFSANPLLRELMVENLGSGEKWAFERRV